MPIDRINIGKSVGPGGASSRSAASAFNPHGNDGPDLGRLLGALGKGMKTLEKVSDDGQQREMDEAEVEIRSVMLKTENERQAGESPEDHRARLDGEISKVRAKWANRDRGFLDNMFQKDDKALDTVDSIHAQSKSLDLRHTLTLLRTQNPHLTTEEYMQKAGNIMEKGFSELGHMGTKHRRDFLRSVNDHTLSEVKTMAAQSEKMDQNINLQKNFSTAYAMQEDTIGKTLGTSPAEASKDIDAFNRFHENWDANQEGMTAGIVSSTKQVYDNALVISNGNKIKASEQALTFATSIAERTGRTEIMDAVATMPLGDKTNGRNLQKFYAKQIDDSKRNVEIQRYQTRNALISKQNSMFEAQNKQQLDAWSNDVDSKIITAVGENATEEGIQESYDLLVRYKKELANQESSGLYKGNQGQAKRLRRMLLAADKMLINERGTEEAREAFLHGMDSGSWNLDKHLKWAAKLDPEHKARSYEHVKAERLRREDFTQLLISDEKINRSELSQGPITALTDDWSVLMNRHADTVDWVNKLKDGTEPIMTTKELKHKMEYDVSKARRTLRNQTEKEENRSPTDAEVREVVEPIIKKHKEDALKESDRLRSMIPKLDKAAIEDETSPESKEFSELLGKADSGNTMAPEDIKKMTEYASKGGKVNPSQITGMAVSHLKNQGDFHKLSDVFKELTSVMDFDLANPEHKQMVRVILEKAFENKSFLRMGNGHIDPDTGKPVLEEINETGTLGNISPGNLGIRMSKALEDNKFLTEEGLTEFFKTIPWGTKPTKSNIGLDNRQEARSRIESELRLIQKFLKESAERQKSKNTESK